MRRSHYWMILWFILPAGVQAATEQHPNASFMLRLDTTLPVASPAAINLPEPMTRPIRVLIDVRSRYSDGAHDLNTLVQLATQRHMDALAITEHDRYTIRFGLDPVPHILGYAREHPSLYQTGVQTFFDALQRMRGQTSLTLLAGTESTPGYYWQGMPLNNLSLHEAERHIITLGANTPENITALPSYRLSYAYGNKTLSLTFWFVLVFGLIFVLLRRRKRGVALLLAGSFIAFMSTWLLKPGQDPYQAFIQTAQRQQLFTIWAHPGTRSGIREGPMGVRLVTPPYNEVVFQSPTADAFAAVYGDNDDNTIPGGLWDTYMMDYLHGRIGKPIWAVAAGDFHEEGQSGEFLGNYPMDVWADSTKQQDILEALKQGRMTAWHMGKHHDLSLNTLALAYTRADTGQNAFLLPGQIGVANPNIMLIAALSDRATDSKPVSLKAQWIVDGQIVRHVVLSSHGKPVQLALTLPAGKHVIRLQIPAQQGIRMEANPFFVDVRSR